MPARTARSARTFAIVQTPYVVELAGFGLGNFNRLQYLTFPLRRQSAEDDDNDEWLEAWRVVWFRSAFQNALADAFPS